MARRGVKEAPAPAVVAPVGPAVSVAPSPPAEAEPAPVAPLVLRQRVAYHLSECADVDAEVAKTSPLSLLVFAVVADGIATPRGTIVSGATEGPNVGQFSRL